MLRRIAPVGLRPRLMLLIVGTVFLIVGALIAVFCAAAGGVPRLGWVAAGGRVDASRASP